MNPKKRKKNWSETNASINLKLQAKKGEKNDNNKKS